MCFSLHRKPKSVQTVKLTPHHRPRPRGVIYVQFFRSSNEPNRPQISSVTSNVKEPRRTKPTVAPNSLRRASLPILAISVPSDPASLRSAPPSGTAVRLSAAGEGVFMVLRRGPQGLFCRKMTKPGSKAKNVCFTCGYDEHLASPTLFAKRFGSSRLIYQQGYPQNPRPEESRRLGESPGIARSDAKI